MSSIPFCNKLPPTCLELDKTASSAAPSSSSSFYLATAYCDSLRVTCGVASFSSGLFSSLLSLVPKEASLPAIPAIPDLLSSFDVDGDGTIGAAELLAAKSRLESFSLIPLAYADDGWSWFLSSMPLWTSYFYRTFGGLLLLVVVATITPGIMHTISGRILR